MGIFLIEGVAVGCGWQALVAYINVGCYYAIGVPLGAILGFYFKMGAKVLIHSCLIVKNVCVFFLIESVTV